MRDRSKNDMTEKQTDRPAVYPLKVHTISDGCYIGTGTAIATLNLGILSAIRAGEAYMQKNPLVSELVLITNECVEFTQLQGVGEDPNRPETDGELCCDAHFAARVVLYRWHFERINWRVISQLVDGPLLAAMPSKEHECVTALLN
jgi:hypothetical protein